MRKALICLTALLCLCAAFASAETQWYITNCDEWVSLRSEPSQSAGRLAKVPAGAQLDSVNGFGSEWACVEYDSEEGYIPWVYIASRAADGEEDSGFNDGTVVLDESFGEYRVRAVRTTAFADDCERLELRCAANGKPRWSRMTSVDYITELDLTDVFVGGTKDAPMLLLYNCEIGLEAIDIATGKTLWTLEQNLGASVVHALANDGTMYFAGFYGPDPVAVSVDGALLWESKQEDYFWPYEIVVRDDSVYTTYDSGDGDFEEGGVVRFDVKTGARLN